MRKTLHITAVSLLLSLSLQGAFTSAYSQGNPGDHIRNLINRYTTTATKHSPEGKLALISTFKNKRYAEVLELARTEITNLLLAKEVDIKTLLAWLEVYESIATQHDAQFLVNISNQISSGHTNIESLDDRSAIFELLQDASGRLFAQEPGELPSIQSELYVAEPISEKLSVERIRALDQEVKKGNLNRFVEANLSNLLLDEREDPNYLPVQNRAAEIDEVSNILVRMNSRVPLVLGEAGVGKSSVVRGLVEKITNGKLPKGIHKKELTHSIILQTSAAKLSSLAEYQMPKYETAVIQSVFSSIKEFEARNNINVVLVIEGANRLSEAQIDAMKPYLTRTTDPYNVILVSSAAQASLKLLGNPELNSVVEPVSVAEFSDKTTFDLIKKAHLKKIEAHYNVRISDDVLTSAIEVAAELRPDLKRPVGPIKVLQDLSIAASREAKGQLVDITRKDLFEFAAKRMRMPVVPQDREAFLAYMQKIKADIKTEVKGQDSAVDRLTDLLGEAMTSKGKKSRAAIVVGTTGTGKTMIAKTLAKKVLGSSERVLEIDMNQLKSDDHGSYLFGPKMGFIGSDKNKGILTEFVDKNGSGTIMIVVNEIEKGDPSQIERLMEPLDTNGFTPSDGRYRQMPRVLWIFTSNQGASNFFPPDFLRSANSEQVASIMSKTTQDDVKNAFLQPTSQAGQKQTVKPEVLARFDAFILQAPIMKDTAVTIAELKTQDQIRTYKAQDLGEIKVDSEFSKVFAEEVYDPAAGVRELERRVRSEVDKLYNEHFRKYGASQSLTVVTNPPAPGSENVTFTVTNERNQVLEINGPKFAFQNPLYNPVVKARLKGLEAALNRDVFGQEAYAQKLAASIRNNVVDQTSNKPVSIYVTGLTGTGKTEMARVLAREYFGSDEYLLKLDMGMVKDVNALSDIFQPAQGFVGSDQPGSFERFLQSHKEGVIVFDEMGNAGGNNKQIKEEIGKYFYPILDDGVWTSPVTKRTYNLKNYLMIFTGNEAEVVFKGNSQDDMLRAIWKKYSTEDAARELLRQSGLSPAFMGRIAAAIVTEPPTTESKAKIAGKEIKKWVAGIEKTQPVKVLYDDQFIAQVSKLVYSPTEGGRSVGNFVKTVLGAAVSNGLFEIDFTDASPEKRAEVKLSLEIKAPARPFYNIKPDETLAKLHVEIVQNGKTIYKDSSDFTAMAKFMKQIRKSDAIKTAFHEAGHAITNDPRITGSRLDHLTITPADKYLGYARYEDIPGFLTSFGESTLLARLTTLVAGSEAELLVGGEVNSGQAGDLKEERTLLTKAAVEWGLVPELQGAKLDSDGTAHFTSRQQAIFAKFSKEMLEKAREKAKLILEENWYLVALVSRELIKNGEISGVRYEELVKKANQMNPEFNEKFKLKMGPEKVKVSLKAYEANICNSILGN